MHCHLQLLIAAEADSIYRLSSMFPYFIGKHIEVSSLSIFTRRFSIPIEWIDIYTIPFSY
nr:MAG TPA: hypothetical protein [Caudoviricetes sp.]